MGSTRVRQPNVIYTSAVQQISEINIGISDQSRLAQALARDRFPLGETGLSLRGSSYREKYFFFFFNDTPCSLKNGIVENSSSV